MFLKCAVVAQPGRALDCKIKQGEAEDRAVVSSNLTGGTSRIYEVLIV